MRTLDMSWFVMVATIKRGSFSIGTSSSNSWSLNHRIGLFAVFKLVFAVFRLVTLGGFLCWVVPSEKVDMSRCSSGLSDLAIWIVGLEEDCGDGDFEKILWKKTFPHTTPLFYTGRIKFPSSGSVSWDASVIILQVCKGNVPAKMLAYIR
jgi:hypothetical protein